MSEIAKDRKQLRRHRLMFWGGFLTIPTGILIAVHIFLTGNLVNNWFLDIYGE
jgi:hypothetical protein